MSKNHDQFVQLLQLKAKQQSKLHHNPFIPKWIAPLPTAVAVYPWQILLLLSFLFAWITLILRFEFLFNIVQNITT